MRNIDRRGIIAAMMTRRIKSPKTGIVITPPTNFSEAYFTINGLIHDLKTYFQSEEASRTPQALSIISRECTKLSSKNCVVGREQFRLIMADYGYVVAYEEARGRGVLVGAGDYLYFSLI